MLYITNIFPLMESYGKWSPPPPVMENSKQKMLLFFLNLGTFLDKDFGFCAIEYVQYSS